MPKIHMFRAGTHTAGTGQTISFSEADVAEMAASYDKSVHAAPIVVGHPKVDAPAYGWIAGVSAEGGNLYAEPEQIEPQFADMVRAGRFRNVSVALYPRDHASNPTPGKYYVKHLGYLGAQPPAVKGLKTSTFNADEKGLVEITFSETTTAALKPADFSELIGGDMPDPKTAEPASTDVAELQRKLAEAEAKIKTTADFAEEQQKLATEKAALEDDKAKVKTGLAALAAASAKQHTDQVAAFCETLTAAGKLAPAAAPGLVAFMESLKGDSEITFAADDGEKKQSALAWLQSFLSEQLNVGIDYSEQAGADKDEPKKVAPRQVRRMAGLGPNDETDPKMDKVAQQAIALCEKRGVDPNKDDNFINACIDIQERVA